MSVGLLASSLTPLESLGSLPAVVIVAIDVEDLLSLYAEHTGQDALGQAGAQDDDIVLLCDVVHGCELGAALGKTGGALGGKESDKQRTWVIL